MHAVEFEADVKNLSVKIPLEFRELDSRHIKFIALYASPKSENSDGALHNIREKAIAFGKKHQTFPLNWSHRKISREKMNER